MKNLKISFYSSNLMYLLITLLIFGNFQARAQVKPARVNFTKDEKAQIQFSYSHPIHGNATSDGWAESTSPTDPRISDFINSSDYTFQNTGLLGIFKSPDLSVCQDANLTGITVSGYNFNQDIQFCKRNEICFPPHTGVPYDRRPPIIDGNITDDVGWTGAYRLNFDYASNPPNVTIQALKHATDNYIYLSFEVDNNMLDADDAIIICLRPKVVYTHPTLEENITAQHEDTRMVLIRPHNWTNCDENVTYYRNSDDLTKITGGINNDHICVSSTTNGWNIELQLPTTNNLTTGGGSNWITLEDDFLLYTNVCAIINTNVGAASEYIWPNNDPVIEGDILSYPNYQNDFGVAHKGTASDCQGIYIANWTDIYTSNIPNHEIIFRLPPATNDIRNTFYAKVTNNSDDPANGVNVTFKIANWGLGNPWSKVPNGTVDPPEGVSSTESILRKDNKVFNIDWTLTPGQITQYNTPTEKHQCILAELNAGPNVNIISKSQVRNMDVVSASKFSRFATIGTNNFGPLPEDYDKHKILLKVFKKEKLKVYDNEMLTDSLKTNRNSKAQSYKKGEQKSCLNYTVHGYRYTGKKLIINETAYDIVDPVGSYGYVVCHKGFVKKWKTELIGAEMISPDTYELEIEPRDSAIVKDVIKPIIKRLSLSIHSGNSVPLGTFANNFDQGFNLILDADYHFSENWALVALIGYNDFKSETAGIEDNYWINISPNIRYYWPFRPPFSVYLGVGPCLYIPENGNNEFGVNAGVGINYKANSTLSFELGTEYQKSFNNDLQFLQNHIGALLRF